MDDENGNGGCTGAQLFRAMPYLDTLEHIERLRQGFGIRRRQGSAKDVLQAAATAVPA